MNDKNSTACTCAACLRELAGQVRFCPFCGTPQPQPVSADSTSAQAAAAGQPATAPAAGNPGIEASVKHEAAARQAEEKAAAEQAEKRRAAELEAAQLKAAEQAAADKKAAKKAAADKTAADKAAAENSAATRRNQKLQEQQSAQPETAPKGPGHDAPGGGGGRKGMGWRTKLAGIGIALLAVLWIKGSLQNKDAQQATQEKLERQMTAAMTLAETCKLDDARAALLALDEAHGTPQQHATVQKVISDAEPGCTNKLRQDAAWTDAKATVERALGNKNFDRADSAIKNFTSRWGEDDASRALLETVNVRHVEALLDEAEECLKSGDLACAGKNLPLAQTLDQGDAKTRIASVQADLVAAREREAPAAPAVQDTPVPVPQPVVAAPQARAKPAPVPVATPPVPAPSPAASALEARLGGLVNDAVKRIREGNYRGAEDLMSMCVSLDPGNQRCQELRHRANQMNRTMLACVASGKEWANERCE